MLLALKEPGFIGVLHLGDQEPPSLAGVFTGMDKDHGLVTLPDGVQCLNQDPVSLS